MLYPHRPTLPKRTEEVQCPACGARNTDDSMLWRDPQTDRLFEDRYGLDPAIGSVVAFVVGGVVFLVANSLLGGTSTCLALVLAAIVPIALLAAYNFRSVKQQERTVRVHSYECRYCGHKWIWQEGTPAPVFKASRRIEIRQDFEEVFGHALEDES